MTASALAGESAVFRGAPGGSGDVIAFDVSAPATAHSVPGLAGVMLLPLDFCGHSAAAELAPRFPRQRPHLPNASRLVLQNGHGSLYRFLRAGAAQLGRQFLGEELADVVSKLEFVGRPVEVHTVRSFASTALKIKYM